MGLINGVTNTLLSTQFRKRLSWEDFDDVQKETTMIDGPWIVKYSTPYYRVGGAFIDPLPVDVPEAVSLADYDLRPPDRMIVVTFPKSK
ncbi:MAG: hypothetical protein ACYCQJ_13895 [Nitrososphaerales archaeon]